MKGKTKTGLEIEIKDSALDNWELVELWGEADKGNTTALISAMKILLGEEGYGAFKEHVRSLSDDGVVHATKMSEELSSFMTSINNGKN
jgi:hypothetical protein|nr:MAG TPA: hypothetical protein [Caudoviricetes sp.]